MSKSFFVIDDSDWFVGQDAARGPWDEHACHAGPVTGVIARALENLVSDKQLMRLNVEVLRPVPMSGFKIDCEYRKQGRMITTAHASVTDRAGRMIAHANSLHATVLAVGDLPTTKVASPQFSEATSGGFPIDAPKHNLPFFSGGIEVRYPPDETGSPGATTIWMKTVPLIEDEEPSPFQSLCPLADCGNGISRNMEVTEANFLNPDLSIVMYRQPESEWLASQARSFWEPTGLGLAEATLFDTLGPIGSATQTLLIQPL